MPRKPNDYPECAKAVGTSPFLHDRRVTNIKANGVDTYFQLTVHHNSFKRTMWQSFDLGYVALGHAFRINQIRTKKYTTKPKPICLLTRFLNSYSLQSLMTSKIKNAKGRRVNIQKKERYSRLAMITTRKYPNHKNTPL